MARQDDAKRAEHGGRNCRQVHPGVAHAEWPKERLEVRAAGVRDAVASAASFDPLDPPADDHVAFPDGSSRADRCLRCNHDISGYPKPHDGLCGACADEVKPGWNTS